MYWAASQAAAKHNIRLAAMRVWENGFASERIVVEAWVAGGRHFVADGVILSRAWLRTSSATAILVQTRQPAALPRPVHNGEDKHADIKFKLTSAKGVAVVGDVSVVHQFQGYGRERHKWGRYKPDALSERVKGKKDGEDDR